MSDTRKARTDEPALSALVEDLVTSICRELDLRDPARFPNLLQVGDRWLNLTLLIDAWERPGQGLELTFAGAGTDGLRKLVFTNPDNIAVLRRALNERAGVEDPP